VATLLDSELGIDDSAMLERIQMGLLLVMQMDPTGASKTILFGHQSFREFLVARYWMHQLLHLAARETKREHRDKIEKRLMQARLLQDEDEAFSLLMDMLRDLDPGMRRDIKEWARKYMNIEELTLHPDEHADRRPVLRESALAIGSSIDPKEGLELDEWALRFLCFWHQFHRRSLTVWAPRLHSPHGLLSNTFLDEANLDGAELQGSNLAGVHLFNSNLSQTNLAGATLIKANLVQANLAGANLAGATLIKASLVQANLAGANLAGAHLFQANLSQTSLAEAILEGASLGGANLGGANLAGANLAGANLAGANLEGASLAGANLAGANLAGANLAGANLERAHLKRMNLREARLHGARVSREQLASAHTEGALGLDEIHEIHEIHEPA
jgi:uncharacterized protein YjbI with pentapeptide repeats